MTKLKKLKPILSDSEEADLLANMLMEEGSDIASISARLLTLHYKRLAQIAGEVADD